MFLMCSLVTLLNSGWNFFSPDSLNLLVLLACNDFVSLDISCLRNFTMHDLGIKVLFRIREKCLGVVLREQIILFVNKEDFGSE